MISVLLIVLCGCWSPADERERETIRGYLEFGEMLNESDPCHECVEFSVQDAIGTRHTHRSVLSPLLRLSSEDLVRIDRVDYSSSQFDSQASGAVVMATDNADSRLKDAVTRSAAERFYLSAGSDLPLAVLGREEFAASGGVFLLYLANQELAAEFEMRVRPSYSAAYDYPTHVEQESRDDLIVSARRHQEIRAKLERGEISTDEAIEALQQASGNSPELEQ
ncbi:MAG: DUF2089 domain-containing protein [bacterium]|nr:DUF2089 domain-containing protein [bacterium]